MDRLGALPEPSEGHASFGGFVTRNPGVSQMMARVAAIAPTDLTVLLMGETGTGKEVIARYLHDESGRRSGPFVAVDCGSLGRHLFASNFFGYEAGAFTGADPRGRKGLVASARGGTLFLDEVGEMSLVHQAGLLRVLETGTYRSIGSDQEMTTDCRVIAATNRPLRELAEQGAFRPDLYYRLSVAAFTIPPLRERPEDVLVLAERIMKAFCERHGVPVKVFSAEAAKALQGYEWPGNVRELRNLVESAVLCGDNEIGLRDLPAEVTKGKARVGARRQEHAGGPGGTVREHQRALILRALARHRNIGATAEALGISRSTLYRKFETLRIDYKALSRVHPEPEDDSF